MEYLLILEKESSDFCLPKIRRTDEFIIAAKFSTSQVLNMEAMARKFKQLWQSVNGFRIRNLGDHKVLFVLENSSDVERIMSCEP